MANIEVLKPFKAYIITVEGKDHQELAQQIAEDIEKAVLPPELRDKGFTIIQTWKNASAVIVPRDIVSEEVIADILVRKYAGKPVYISKGKAKPRKMMIVEFRAKTKEGVYIALNKFNSVLKKEGVGRSKTFWCRWAERDGKKYYVCSVALQETVPGDILLKAIKASREEVKHVKEEVEKRRGYELFIYTTPQVEVKTGEAYVAVRPVWSTPYKPVKLGTKIYKGTLKLLGERAPASEVATALAGSVCASRAYRVAKNLHEARRLLESAGETPTTGILALTKLVEASRIIRDSVGVCLTREEANEILRPIDMLIATLKTRRRWLTTIAPEAIAKLDETITLVEGTMTMRAREMPRLAEVLEDFRKGKLVTEYVRGGARG